MSPAIFKVTEDVQTLLAKGLKAMRLEFDMYLTVETIVATRTDHNNSCFGCCRFWIHNAD